MSSPKTASIRPLQRADAPAVQRLWSRRFGGESSTQQKWIDVALSPTHPAVGLVAVAPATDEVLGCSFLEVGAPAYTRRYLGLDALDLDVPIAERNGLFHLTCVRADWEGQGIGTAFYKRRLELLVARDVDRAFGIAWHRPRYPVDSRALFEAHGFACVETIERYYARTTPRPDCPDCGGPCTCTASLYARLSLHG